MADKFKAGDSVRHVGPTNLNGNRGTVEGYGRNGWVLVTFGAMESVPCAECHLEQVETLWCESCGESPQEVRSTHAGLCGDCYGASISEVVKDATGDHICGHPLYYGGKVFAVCCLPHGQEHDHGTIQY